MSKSYEEIISMENELDDVIEVIIAFMEKWDVDTTEIIEKIEDELSLQEGNKK